MHAAQLDLLSQSSKIVDFRPANFTQRPLNNEFLFHPV
jgi:hypothetical protein